LEPAREVNLFASSLKAELREIASEAVSDHLPLPNNWQERLVASEKRRLS
jgi:hypothetical protein